MHDTSVVSFDYGMDEQSKLFGHASWKFEKEADLLLSTLVKVTKNGKPLSRVSPVQSDTAVQGEF